MGIERDVSNCGRSSKKIINHTCSSILNQRQLNYVINCIKNFIINYFHLKIFQLDHIVL